MNVVYLTRRYRFSAGHRLFHPERDEEWNRGSFGDCSYPGGHGHNYELYVTLRGCADPETGMLFPTGELDAFVEQRVLRPLDHRNLNDVLELKAGPSPTTEVLLVEIWDRLTGPDGLASPGVRLHRLKLSETAKNTFEYSGPGREPPASKG